MCLWNEHDPSPEELKTTEAYKVFRETKQNQLTYIYGKNNNSYKVHRGKWHINTGDPSNITSRLGSPNDPTLGFHVFKTEQSAKDYALSIETVCLVKIKGVTRSGEHASHNDSLRVQQFKIVKTIQTATNKMTPEWLTNGE